MYEYQAWPDRVIDGDTFDMEVDLGFSVRYETRVRLLEVNTGEFPSYLYFPNISMDDLDEDEYGDAIAHYEFVQDWFGTAINEHDGEWPVIVQTKKDKTGKYGRYLARIRRKSDAEDLSEALIDEFGDDVLY